MTGFHPKVTAAALAGALTTIIISELGKHGYPIDGSEGAAIAVVLSFIVGWFTPSDGADQPPAAIRLPAMQSNVPIVTVPTVFTPPPTAPAPPSPPHPPPDSTP